MPLLYVFQIAARAKLRCRRRLSSFLPNPFICYGGLSDIARGKGDQITANTMRKHRWRISGKPSFSLAGVTNERINGGHAQREREASHAGSTQCEQGVSANMAASWYKRRHRYVDNQRVKLKIVLPITTAMAKFAIDSASLESLHSWNKSGDFHFKSGGREIFIIM